MDILGVELELDEVDDAVRHEHALEILAGSLAQGSKKPGGEAKPSISEYRTQYAFATTPNSCKVSRHRSLVHRVASEMPANNSTEARERIVGMEKIFCCLTCHNLDLYYMRMDNIDARSGKTSTPYPGEPSHWDCWPCGGRGSW
jgi:hypothetical protein